MSEETGTPGGPLSGFRIIELAGIGPGPYCGQLLADLGAEVIEIQRPGRQSFAVEGRGKKSIIVDLRQPAGAEIVLRLVEGADALIEGNRPGVTERLGIGPAECQARNPRLVYGRMTGWGQTGPLAPRAGHDINYIGLTGALEAMGRRGSPPSPPLNLVGDYGGGSLFLAFGVTTALLAAQRSGRGDIVDAAIVDGVASMMGILHSLDAAGMWRPRREANLLDGAMPFYRCYETRDGRFMAVGCLEPEFFAIMLDTLEIDAAEFGAQNDPAAWAGQHRRLEDVFAARTRAEWTALFDGTDACVTPVLDYVEARAHPHAVARGAHVEQGKVAHPAVAPRFAAWPQPASFTTSPTGTHTTEVLAEAGYSPAEIDRLIAAGAAAHGPGRS